MSKIYCIHDVVSGLVVGGLHLFPADAAAMRMFADVAGSPDTLISRHPSDFQLVCLGELVEPRPGFTDLPQAVQSDPFVVLTGSQWSASQTSQEV